MPVKRRKLKNRSGYTDAEIMHLALSFDWFGDGFGYGPDADAAMREAWSKPDVRRRCYAMLAERQARGVSLCYDEPWAATKFADP